MDKKVVAISGGFDPIHIGHVKLMKTARKLGTELVVILNNNNWLKRKKGYYFMDELERKEILEELNCVDKVIITKHSMNDNDRSVCNEIAELNPDIFANGGDQNAETIPEYTLCEKNGIQMIFGIGGDKIQSSSDLAAEAFNKAKDGKL